MARYKYGKKFKKNGRLVQYRYTNGRKSTKKLVNCKKSRRSSASKPYAGRRYTGGRRRW